MCVNRCEAEGFPYAGTVHGTQCWCGHGYGSSGTSTGCTKSCNADRHELCGGTSKYRVWQIHPPPYTVPSQSEYIDISKA